MSVALGSSVIVSVREVGQRSIPLSFALTLALSLADVVATANHLSLKYRHCNRPLWPSIGGLITRASIDWPHYETCAAPLPIRPNFHAEY